LKALRNLRWLSVTETKVTSAGEQELRRAVAVTVQRYFRHK